MLHKALVATSGAVGETWRQTGGFDHGRFGHGGFGHGGFDHGRFEGRRFGRGFYAYGGDYDYGYCNPHYYPYGCYGY
jgi:hypothetical protein